MKSIWKKLGAVLLVGILALTATACGSSSKSDSSSSKSSSKSEGTLNNYSKDKPVTVKVGLTAAIYKEIWDPIAKDLKKEGINIEQVQFSDYVTPDEALENGEVTITSHQHHAFLKSTVKDKGWNDLVSAGDTFIIAMNLYSKKYKDVKDIPDKATIAIPNDASNEGRALKLLADAGLIKLNDDENPNLSSITENPKNLEFKELNAADVAPALPDVDAAVINGNYALDADINPDSCIYKETKYSDDSYFCLIAVKEKNKDTKAVKRIVERFQSDATKKVFKDKFNGYFVPA
ncbi:MAG: MetQ/NlpA family ABC transporter substrate-binding protein, partial [Eubacteriales bacterium]|nr:MetQ/NlpA family ABC transporter substrate-binding protein [Eubacteriales bacterium]